MKILTIFVILLGIFYFVDGHRRINFNMCRGRRRSKQYITNPGFPSSSVTNSSGLVQSYLIKRCRLSCQLRLDFVQFTLAQPSGDGVCNVDRFEVNFASTTVPVLCGENTGQHMYVNFLGINPMEITIKLTGASGAVRRWYIKLTQIRCFSPTRAPAGCLQYFSTTTGVVKSFNYGQEANPALNSLGLPGTRQLAGNVYNVCIRTLLRRCSVTWSRLQSDPYSFTLTEDVTGVDPTLLGTSVLQSQTCTTDFITIPGATQNNVVLASTNFCGMGFVSTTSSIQPFQMKVTTNADEQNDISNRGFYLTFTQNICPVI